MVATKPRSIMEVFLNSIQACKEIFIPMIPISVLCIVVQAGFRMMMKSGLPFWASLGFTALFFLLSLFCFYWAICFTYDALVRQKIDYLVSLKRAAKNFFKAFMLPASFNLIAMAIYYLQAYYGSGFANVSNIGNFGIVNALFLTLALLLAYGVFVFSIIYTIDILTKDADILQAIKSAFRVILMGKGIKGVLYFIALSLLAGFVSMLAFSILVVFVSVILKPAFSSVVVAVLGTLFFIPFNLVILINFYHDLLLRFEVCST